ncbi:hypothetical protein ACFC0S_03050 [Streptomyces sp. NPDC056084]|uniref:hypothetical protein n=1 Tax=unclassified Streptomyces TaxID=2593676 RepID=UPI0035E0E663
MPTAEYERADQAMRHHAARTGHAVFARRFDDIAVVTLADKAEQERRAEVNGLELASTPAGRASLRARMRPRPADVEPDAEHGRAAP